MVDHSQHEQQLSLNHLQERFRDRNSFRVTQDIPTNKDRIPYHIRFFHAQDDIGVILNGGRPGARYAAEVLQKHFQTFIAPHNYSGILDFEQSLETNFSSSLSCFSQASWSQTTISHRIDEQLSFHHRAQLMNDQQESDYQFYAQDLRSSFSCATIHLAAGHDHIYPWAKALIKHQQQQNKQAKTYILNLDAHLDSRMEQKGIAHSGTPFRQLANEFSSEKLSLFQWGTVWNANPASNVVDMKFSGGVSWRAQQLSQQSSSGQGIPHVQKAMRRLESFLQQIRPEDQFIISLDVDVLRASDTKAVSAVNAFGISWDDLYSVWQLIQKNLPDHYFYKSPLRLGIYEYNPLFDDLGAPTARSLCGWMSTLIEDYLLSKSPSK